MKTPNGAWIYCFKRKDSAVFLNRRDEVIKEFKTYDEAIEFATVNMNLIEPKDQLTIF
jgi:hypothetical protein